MDLSNGCGEFSELLNGFVDIWISLSCYMDLSKDKEDLLKLLHGFVEVFQCFLALCRNKTKLMFDQDFEAC